MADEAPTGGPTKQWLSPAVNGHQRTSEPPRVVNFRLGLGPARAAKRTSRSMLNRSIFPLSNPTHALDQIVRWTSTRDPLTILQIVRMLEAAMAFATVTSKGQTTIPKQVRAAANLKAGDRIHFTVLEDGTIIVRVKNRSIRNIAFKPPGGKRVSIAQMNR